MTKADSIAMPSKAMSKRVSSLTNDLPALPDGTLKRFLFLRTISL